MFLTSILLLDNVISRPRLVLPQSVYVLVRPAGVHEVEARTASRHRHWTRLNERCRQSHLHPLPFLLLLPPILLKDAYMNLKDY